MQTRGECAELHADSILIKLRIKSWTLYCEAAILAAAPSNLAIFHIKILVKRCCRQSWAFKQPVNFLRHLYHFQTEQLHKLIKRHILHINKVKYTVYKCS